VISGSGLYWDTCVSCSFRFDTDIVIFARFVGLVVGEKFFRLIDPETWPRSVSILSVRCALGATGIGGDGPLGVFGHSLLLETFIGAGAAGISMGTVRLFKGLFDGGGIVFVGVVCSAWTCLTRLLGAWVF
jgi:hypothetical protein